jgi:hypothetical protein
MFHITQKLGPQHGFNNKLNKSTMLRAFHNYEVVERIRDWFTSKNPMNGSHYSYANTLEKYNDLNEYSDVYDQNISRRKITTDVDLEYSKYIQFGTSINEVKKIMPKRTHQISFNSNSLYRKVLLYRVKIHDQNVKIELHFYQNKLFYYKFIFSYASPIERKELSRGLINKYKLPNLDLTSHTIFDKNRNCIQVDDYMEYTISYTQMNNPFFKIIDNLKAKSHEEMLARYNQQTRPLF